MPDVTVTLASLPTPCTPGQVFTLKWVCNGDGTGGTFFLHADATTVGAPLIAPVNHIEILAELRKAKFTPEQVIAFFESIKPAKPCGG